VLGEEAETAIRCEMYGIVVLLRNWVLVELVGVAKSVIKRVVSTFNSSPSSFWSAFAFTLTPKYPLVLQAAKVGSARKRWGAEDPRPAARAEAKMDQCPPSAHMRQI
jgi:hypothetical protein